MDMKGLGETRPELDTRLMGRVLREAVESNPAIRTLNPGLRMATKTDHDKAPVSSNVIAQAVAGGPTVTEKYWRRLAEPIGYGRDFLIIVGEHDWAELKRLEVDPDLIGFARRNATRSVDSRNSGSV